MADLPYRRVLLKISGESLASSHPPAHKSRGIDPLMLEKVASDIKVVHDMGVQIGLVIGGGNIYRGAAGAQAHGIDRVTSDYMGMLATIINAFALQSVLEFVGVPCRVMTAISMPLIGEAYAYQRALGHLKKGRVVIFAAGTGHPFFTTDTAAAMRASEMDCDLLLKATKVEGVYSSDPVQNPEAIFFPQLTYTDLLTKNLDVMDTAAVSLARDNRIPIAVFSIFNQDGFRRVLKGEGRFTFVSAAQEGEKDHD